MKNYLWNMFSNIKNGQLAKNSFILQPSKKICEKFLKILWSEGFILGYKKEYDFKNKKSLKIFLKYKKGRPVIKKLELITKPGHRIYYSTKHIWKIPGDSNKTIILSTNVGLKTLVSCKKLKIGGEPYLVLN